MCNLCTPVQVLQAPLLWLFPLQTSLLQQEGGEKTTSLGRLKLAVIRLVIFVASVGLLAMYGPFHHHSFDCVASLTDCALLPPWLRKPWWSSNATCPVRADNYNTCLEQLPFYLEGACNFRAGYCSSTGFLPKDLWNFVSAVIGLGPFCGLVATPVLYGIYWCCCRRVDPEEEKILTGEVEEPKEASTLDQMKFFLLTLLPFLADFFLDANGIIQFIRTGNFLFALVSAAIFVMSIWQQIRRGAFHKLLSSCQESLQAGKATDDLELIMLSEKSLEAPLQLMLQWYAFIFVTSRVSAVFFFFFSICFSFKSVAEAVYNLVELDLFEMMLMEEESTSSSDSSDYD